MSSYQMIKVNFSPVNETNQHHVPSDVMQREEYRITSVLVLPKMHT